MDQSSVDNQQNVDIRELLIKIGGMDAQMKAYKAITGGALLLALSALGSVIFATFSFADEYAQLKKEVAIQSSNIVSHGIKIDKAQEERGSIREKMVRIDSNTGHTKEKVEELHSLVEGWIKNQRR